VVERLGRERFNRELQTFFDQGLFNMTNQPDVHAPFLFAVTGEPWRTQAVVDGILNRPMDHNYTNQGRRPEPWRGLSFDLAPQGYADGMDDDAGAMSAWYVFASLGLYPLVPGQPYYALTTPAFDAAVLDVGGGRRFEIIRRGPAGAPWIESVSLNGAPIDRAWLSHAEIAAGGRLEVQVGLQPNRAFGSTPSFPPLVQ
jgi:putative alpha-1,2-mannosidase